MENKGKPMDWMPNTPTARALATAGVAVAAGSKPTPGRYKEIPIDPDAPDAPLCSGRKYIVADPDAPDAPTCKPKKYIVAPDTAPSSALPAWAGDFARDLASRFESVP